MRRSCLSVFCFAAIIVPVLAPIPSAAQTQLSSDLRAQIDKVAHEALAGSGVPSASIAIVKNGEIAYVQAYGLARIDSGAPARPEMRYSIGSISKQFTAVAILLSSKIREEDFESLDL